jgi:glycosyltransferase involved in cell wall biosynthesis
MVRFLVVIPTFNRAAFLPQAIESVVAQTHKGWHLMIVDDGSTDGTREVVGRYAASYDLSYVRSEENKGGVAANAVGMTVAIEHGFDAWVRLGSDDWFLPRKLELDALALQYADACFGPYQNEPPSYGGELNGPSDARAALLRGEFAASWANVAFRTSVLKKVFERHGDFVDARLRNMEDYLFNVRAARFTEFAWRGELATGNAGRIVIGARSVAEAAVEWNTMRVFDPKPDARYRIGADPVCCSNSPEGRVWGARDAVMTEIVRGEDAAKGFAVDEIAPVELRFIP